MGEKGGGGVGIHTRIDARVREENWQITTFVVSVVGWLGWAGQGLALRGAMSQGATCVLDVEPHGGQAGGRGLLAEPE